MQRVTVWHRCMRMEVRLTSLQAHTDLKWQIAPCWERSIFGATLTPTQRVTNAADYIHTLWNSWNYTKLWTSLAHRKYTRISRWAIYNVKNIKAVHPFYFPWTLMCQSKRLLKLLSAQSKSIQSRQHRSSRPSPVAQKWLCTSFFRSAVFQGPWTAPSLKIPLHQVCCERCLSLVPCFLLPWRSTGSDTLLAILAY